MFTIAALSQRELPWTEKVRAGKTRPVWVTICRKGSAWLDLTHDVLDAAAAETDIAQHAIIELHKLAAGGALEHVAAKCPDGVSESA